MNPSHVPPKKRNSAICRPMNPSHVPPKKRDSMFRRQVSNIDENNETFRTVISTLLLLGNANVVSTQTETTFPNQQDSTINRIIIPDATNNLSISQIISEKRKLKLESAKAAQVVADCDALLPDWMTTKIREIEGSNPILVLQKELHDSDVDKSKYRLSIPINQTSPKNFMTAEEINFLNTFENHEHKKRTPKSIPVMVIDPRGNVMEGMKLVKWAMNSNTYNLGTTIWNEIVKTNELKEGMRVQIWSFRIQVRLCFAIIRVNPPQLNSNSS
ncbi:B3 domain-containing protein At2g31720-like [Impatiens glandulifera]|uniref:B3 domain-containing protein At2g31720-like n=1 Tax=Impatiens glandulifera TaxID=253017 RepID=UPI001FB0F4B1|nr:B3 domain-containing protein At2g31720-like [Impatiens glandulifera]